MVSERAKESLHGRIVNLFSELHTAIAEAAKHQIISHGGGNAILHILRTAKDSYESTVFVHSGMSRNKEVPR